jgi:hypothetical protein
MPQALHKADSDIVKARIDANTCKKVIRENRERILLFVTSGVGG